MKIIIGVLVLVNGFLVSSCSYAQHKQTFDRTSLPTSDSETRYLHNGQEFTSEAIIFFAKLDLSHVDNLVIDDEVEKALESLTNNEKDLIWLRMTEELPEGINFSLLKISSVNGETNAAVWFQVEGVDYDFDLPANEFIKGFAYDGFENEHKPRLDKSYVNFERWDKEQGYREAKKYIENRYHRSVEITVLFEEIIDEDGNPDLNGYTEILNSIDQPRQPEDFVVLSDGKRAIALKVILESLEGMFNEPKVINIIPNIPN